MRINELKIIWARIRAGTVETINKYSAQDLNYRPFENGYSVGQIMLHIAHEEHGEVQYGLTRALDAFPPGYVLDDFRTPEEIKALLDDVHAGTLAYLDTLEDGELERNIEVQWGQTGPLIEFIHHVIEHEIHHRGELSLILGLLERQGFDA